MKKMLFPALILAFSFTACEKKQAEVVTSLKTAVISNGVIVSFSPDKCACCWGWNIIINNKYYRIDKMPENASFDLERETFPIPVTIEWSESKDDCKGITIDVLNISKI